MTCPTPDCSFVHHAPAFVLAVHVCCERYNRWLSHQAESCRRRDLGWNKRPGLSEYKRVIHKKVVESAGSDFYTGLPIRWDLLNNQRATSLGRAAHRRRGRYSSVDHYKGVHCLDYRICTGQVNHAKGALTHDGFVDLCRHIVRQADAGRPLGGGGPADITASP